MDQPVGKVKGPEKAVEAAWGEVVEEATLGAG
jgi:hypothetical protein